jgi:hypothetical protein
MRWHGGNRPERPRGGNYEPPHINVHLLRHQGLYSEAAPDLELPLALHHVIPWEFLWHFWNALIGQQYYDAARDFLSIYGFHKAQTESWISNMEARRFSDPNVGGIEQRLCWAEWNLVRGPAHRTTAESEGANKPGIDPGPDLDDMQRGAAADDAGRIRQLLDIGRFMSNITITMNLHNYNKDINKKVLKDKIRSWTVLAHQPLIEFNPNMWSIETRSPPYSPSVDHSKVVHPLWNKA